MGGISRTIKTVKTVTSELKSKAKKSQDFYTQIVRTIGLNSRFPLKRRSSPNGLLFSFDTMALMSDPKTPLPGVGGVNIIREKFVSLRIPQKETPEISAALKKDNLSL